MKLTSNYKRKVINEDGECEITFSVPQYQSKWLNELDKSKQYDLDITEFKTSRTKKQNSALWLLLGEIDKVQNGGKRTQYGDEEIYANALERANIKYEVILGLPSTRESLKRAYRAVTILEYRQVKDKLYCVYKCFDGSSKMNVSQLNNLIDIVLDIASENGLDITYWEGQFEFKRK